MPDTEITFKFDSSKLFDSIASVGDGGSAIGQRVVSALLSGRSDFMNSLGLSFYGIEVVNKQTQENEITATGETPDMISRAEYDQIVKDRGSLMAKLEYELFNHDLCKEELDKVRNDHKHLEAQLDGSKALVIHWRAEADKLYKTINDLKAEMFLSEIGNQLLDRSEDTVYKVHNSEPIACLKTRLAISEAEATNCRIERDHYKNTSDTWQKNYTTLKETVNKDWLRPKPTPYHTPQDDGINAPPPTGGSGVIPPADTINTITELLQEARDIVSSMPGLNALQSQAYRDGNWDAGGTIDLALSAIKRGIELSRKK